MIIHQIDPRRVLEREDQPPVSRYPDRPLTIAVSLEGMQPISGHVQGGRVFPPIQQDQHAAQFGGEAGIDPACVAGREQSLKALMAEPPVDGLYQPPLPLTYWPSFRHPPARPEDLSRHGACTDPPVEPGDDGEVRVRQRFGQLVRHRRRGARLEVVQTTAGRRRPMGDHAGPGKTRCLWRVLNRTVDKALPRHGVRSEAGGCRKIIHSFGHPGRQGQENQDRYSFVNRNYSPNRK